MKKQTNEEDQTGTKLMTIVMIVVIAISCYIAFDILTRMLSM